MGKKCTRGKNLGRKREEVVQWSDKYKFLIIIDNDEKWHLYFVVQKKIVYTYI